MSIVAIICIVATSYGFKRETCLQTFGFAKADCKVQSEWLHDCFKDFYRRNFKR